MKTKRPSRFAVIVNESANDGRASLRWAEIREEVKAMLPPGTSFHCFKTPFHTDPLIQELLRQKVDCFISAGGDGSVHYLLNQLLRLGDESTGPLFLGGIGLGSSNDFAKPKQHFIRQIPVRIGWECPLLADVGKVVFTNPEGRITTRYFIANASMGVTAEANWLFDHEDWLIRRVKKRWVKPAILYAALKTILTYKSYPVTCEFDGTLRRVELSNLAVLKNPFVSGNFRYDQPVKPDDGMLGMNLCEGMNRFELFGILSALGKGHFTGLPKTFSAMVKALSVRMEGFRALEMDGEVVRASDVRFTVIPGAVHLLEH